MKDSINIIEEKIEESTKIDGNVNKDILFTDFPELKVTVESKKNIVKNSQKCGYRIASGMFRTDEEKEKYIKDSLERKLPGDKEKNPVLRKVFK